MQPTQDKPGPRVGPSGPPPSGTQDKRRDPGTPSSPDDIGPRTTLAALTLSLAVALLTVALMWLALSFVGAAAANAQQPAGTAEEDAAEPEAGRLAYDQDELNMVVLINGYREENSLEPLLVSDTASLAAKRHSEDMARYGYMDHDTQQSAYFPEGATFDERMDESGYDHDTARSENIAAGDGAEETFERWRESSGHEANMLDPEMKVIGVGASGSEDGEYDTYWTTDFGAHADDTATPVHRITAEEGTSAAEQPRTEERDLSSTAESGTAGSSEEQPPEDGEAENPEPPDQAGNQDEGVTSPTTGATPTEDQYAPDPSEDQYASESSEDGGSNGEAGEGAEEQTQSGQPEGQSPEGEEQTPRTDAPNPDGEQREAPAEDEDCDTLAGFDLSPFDSGFGEELSERIRAKVDCKLEQHSVDEASGSSTTATTSESEQQIITTGSTDSASDSESRDDAGDSGGQTDDGGLFSAIFGSEESGDPAPDAGRPGEDKDEGYGGAPPDEAPDSSRVRDSSEPIVASAPDQDTGSGQQAATDDGSVSDKEEAGSSGDGSWTLIGPASTEDAPDSEERGTGEPDTDEGPDGETGAPKLALTDEPEDDARR